MSAVAAPDVQAPGAPAERETRPPRAARTRVLLVTEGTYPFHWGGVSTWCHALTHGLTDVDFTLLALARDPLVERRFELAPNVVDFRPIPLWGVRNAWEFGPDPGLRTVRRRVRPSDESALAAGFISPFATVVRELLGASRDDVQLAEAIHALYRFFLDHDFDATFRSRDVWDSFCIHVARTFPVAAARLGYPGARASLADATAGIRWLYHWFFPLSQPLPRPDVVHTAMVGSCTLLAAAIKLEHRTPFLLSEHGIYLRERYLAEHASSVTLFRKLLLLGFARRMTELSYALADVVSPCCDYNRRWELRNGARPELLETAYYGLEPRPGLADARPARDGPVVVWAGRIDPLKDLETLLRAAALVLDARPDVRFRLFGSAQPGREWYFRRCLGLHRRLGLGEAVRFEGFREDTSGVIAEADLVVLSSISEGFPFTTLEAMRSGKPVVATAVGGVCEQVPDSCGVTVEPRQPWAFAEAILDVLGDPDAYARRSRAARERAATLFSAERFRATHRDFYERLAQVNGNGGPGRVRMAVAPSPGPAPEGQERREHTDRLHALATELADQIHQPVDPLELAAVIESLGITDAAARERYGMPGTFELADRIFAEVMALRRPPPAEASEREQPSRRVQRGRAADLMRGPIALVPLIVLLCTIYAFADVGWDSGRLFALSLGMTVSVAVAGAFLGGVARRAALYLGVGYSGLADRLLTGAIAVAALAITTVGVLGFALASAFGAFAPDERLVFLVGLVSFTAVVLVVAKLSIAGATGWVGGGLGAGLGAALLTRQVAGWGTAAQLLLALSVGAGVALGVMVWAARRVYGARDVAALLPPRSQLVLESLPYFAYGGAFLAFLLEVHVFGWLGARPAGMSRLDAIAALEVGLTLALPPVILASGLAEHTLRLFWLEAKERQDTVAARSRRRYGRALQAFYDRRLFDYLLTSAVLALVMLAAFELALRSAWLDERVTLPDPEATEFVFVVALLAFWLVGWGQLNCMFLVNLARPTLAFGPVLMAMGVAAVTGVPLAAAGFQYSSIGFVAGSAAFVWASSFNCRQVLAAADHHYAMAL
jgi:glycosyltransferase involved in cell wall biosynthesis